MWLVSHLAQPRPAAPPGAPTQPARGMSGIYTWRTQNPDIQQAGQLGVPGRAARKGRARLGFNRIIRPGNKSLQGIEKRRLNVSLDVRTSEIFCTPIEERNHPLTSGFSAVYQRGEKCLLFLAADQWNGAALLL